MLALLLVAPAFAQAPYASEALSTNEQSPSTAIGVSGAWTLTVYEADGTLVERREFHNDLVPSGADVLVSLATAGRSAGYWTVEVTGNPSPCLLNGGNASCLMFPATIPESGSNEFSNLVVSSLDQDADGADDTIALNGSLTAAQAGNIAFVITRLATCASSVSPDNCVGNQFSSFTERGLANPLSVDVGQVVQVEVLIGFGAATAATARTAPANRASFN